MMFQEGNKVEVFKGNKEQYGSWFPAKVLSVHRDSYTVRYELYLTPEGRPVVETVNEAEVRPCPPLVHGKEQWIVGEIAEVLDTHSWRVGKVAKVLKNDCIVTRLFGSIQLKEFHISKLRVRQAWQKNKWLTTDEFSREKIEYASGTHVSSKYTEKLDIKRCQDQDKETWNGQRAKQNPSLCVPPVRTLKRNLNSQCGLFPDDMVKGICKKRKGELHQLMRKALPEKVDVVSFFKDKVTENCLDKTGKDKIGRHAQVDAGNDNPNNVAINISSMQVTEENNECSVASCSGIKFPGHANEVVRRHFENTVSLGDAMSACPDEGGKAYKNLSVEELAVDIHDLELHAYQSTMQALHASGPLSWEQESLLTNLRLSLNISNEEHLLHLRQLLSA